MSAPTRRSIPNIQSELRRWASFNDWPLDAVVSATALAAMGFFRKPNSVGQAATCSSCGWTNSDWNTTEPPLALHKRMQPDCSMLKETGHPSTVSSLSDELDVKSCVNGNFSGVQAEGTDQPFHAICTDEFNIYEEPLLSKLRGVDDEKLDYTQEKHRLVTFLNPTFKRSCSLDPVAIARAGLYYVGIEDKVQCPFCNHIFGDWKVDSSPQIVHRQASTACSFFSVHSKNVPWDEIENSLWSADLTKSGVHRCQAWPPLLNVYRKKPKSPGYKSMKLRLNSYKHWQCHDVQAPSLLADAGLFFTGLDDVTECWHCGGQLRNWKADDDAWVEHARYFSDCEFVLHNKGIDFIAEAKVQLPISPGLRDQVWRERYGDQFEKYEGELEQESYLLKVSLDSPVYRRLIDIGFNKELVKKVLINQLRLNGHGFRTPVEMAKAYLEREDEIDAEFTEKHVDLQQESRSGNR